jgi:hypothetical protein
MNDPRFVEEAGRAGIAVDPIYGEQLQSIVMRMLATPRDIVGKMEDAISLRGVNR